MLAFSRTRSAFAAALSLLCVSLSSTALALGPDCVAPGPSVLTDAAGDQIGNTDTDLRSVQISENATASRNLVFTIKTGVSTGAMTPNGRWLVTFKANTPAKDYNVAMITSPESNGGAPTFHYGSGLNTDGFTDSAELGRGLAGSNYDAASGTITIVAPLSAFGLAAGDAISGLAGDVKLSGGACGIACLNGASADLATSTETYTVAAACGTPTGGGSGGSSGTNTSAPGPLYGGRDLDRTHDSRFQVFEPPAGIGADGSGGEYSIGFNPATKRIMANSMGFSPGGLVNIELFSAKVFRITPPEERAPVLLESCDALWEDKSNLYNDAYPQVLADPILWTDQDTGRTFSANLTVGPNPSSAYAYTDDDGENWVHGGTGIAGADHQTIVSGFYPANSPFELVARTIGYGQKDSTGKVVKGKAVYFCSQDLIPGTCVRSDDGGNSWSPPQVAYDGSLCSNLHGHLKIAPDGSAYLPIKGCGANQGGTYTHDAGLTWTQFTVPGTTPQADGSDPSIAIDDGGKLYYCYVNGDGRARVRVGSKKADGVVEWNGPDTDLGSAHGIRNASFPEAVGGDPGRAACGFLGTNEPGVNYQSRDFDGIWYLYIATTTDGGATWTTVNATPNDPVQGVGGIWQQGGNGDTNNNRNLLDFNEVTIDDKGRVLFGYNDGCVGACNADPVGAVTNVASMRVARQTGGRTLRAAFDGTLAVARVPGEACFAGTDAGANVRLEWKRPESGGSALRYEVEEVFQGGGFAKIGETSGQSFVVPTRTLATSAYRIRAVNGSGGTTTRVVGNPAVPVVVNRAPVSSLTVTPTTVVEGDSVSFAITLSDPDGDALRYELDFGDNSAKQTGTSGGTVTHVYPKTGAQTFTAKLTVVETAKTPALTAPEISATITQTAASGGDDPAITIQSFTATPNSGTVRDDEPLEVELKATATDSDPAKGVVSYTFYFGDGSNSGRLLEPTVRHRYTRAGTFNATVIVADDNGNSATAETTITLTTDVVVNPGPVTAVLDATFESGTTVPATVMFDGSGSTSPQGATYRFDFGDGSSVLSGTERKRRHVFTTPGNYTVKLTVTDKDDATNTSEATMNITITATEQTVAQLIVRPSVVRVGETVTLDASDSRAATGQRIKRYRFDFGDGSPIVVKDVPSPDDGSAAKATHVYAKADTYTPSVTVEDDRATTGTAKSSVRVNPAPVTSAPGTPAAPPANNSVRIAGEAPSSGGAPSLALLLPLLLLAGLRRKPR